MDERGTDTGGPMRGALDSITERLATKYQGVFSHEIGLDVTQDFPKPLTDIVVRAADVVITMGCGDACPIYPGKRYEEWDVPNPADQPLEVVRGIRDEIQEHVKHLLETLPAPTDAAHVGSAS